MGSQAGEKEQEPTANRIAKGRTEQHPKPGPSQK
jgi:hypothetical protein